jgi:hypothetical protein
MSHVDVANTVIGGHPVGRKPVGSPDAARNQDAWRREMERAQIETWFAPQARAVGAARTAAPTPVRAQATEQPAAQAAVRRLQMDLMPDALPLQTQAGAVYGVAVSAKADEVVDSSGAAGFQDGRSSAQARAPAPGTAVGMAPADAPASAPAQEAVTQPTNPQPAIGSASGDTTSHIERPTLLLRAEPSERGQTAWIAVRPTPDVGHASPSAAQGVAAPAKPGEALDASQVEQAPPQGHAPTLRAAVGAAMDPFVLGGTLSDVTSLAGRPPLRLYAEHGERGQVVWIAIRQDDEALRESLPQIVAQLREEFGVRGLGLHQVVCNGRIVWSNDKAGHRAPLADGWEFFADTDDFLHPSPSQKET